MPIFEVNFANGNLFHVEAEDMETARRVASEHNTVVGIAEYKPKSAAVKTEAKSTPKAKKSAAKKR